MQDGVLSVTGLILSGMFTPLVADSWNTVTAMPESKWELAAATGGDGLVYAIGGMNDSGASINRQRIRV